MWRGRGSLGQIQPYFLGILMVAVEEELGGVDRGYIVGCAIVQ